VELTLFGRSNGFFRVLEGNLLSTVTRSGLILDNRYRLEEPIASGGVGEVWRGTDVLLDRRVAVKLLRPEYADHPETLARFRAEARHAGALSHPRIAKVYDYGEPGPFGPPYLVMELVDGPSLADLLDVRPLSPVRVLDVVAQTALGLDAAHEAGLVHRDIKPGNILLCPDGVVKITDFGIASAAGTAPVTRPGVVMGTTQYLAPERATGGGGTPASDLYSLGIVAYECVTGAPPFIGTTAEVMASHLYQPLPPLPQGVPPELGELLACLTAKNPKDRFASAAELAAVASQLYAKLTGDTIAEPPDGPGQQSEPPRQRSAPRTEQVPWTGYDPGESGGDSGGEPFAPADPGTPGRRSRRRTTVAVAASATVLAGAAAGLLVSGAFQAAPTAEQHAPTPHNTHLQLVTPATDPPASPRTSPSGASTGNGPGTGHGKDHAAHGGSGGQPTQQGKRPSQSASPSSSGSPGPKRTPSPSGSPSPTSPSPSSTGGGGLPLPLPSFSLFGIPL
jgi:eukaryotic-like serine/threonine-protein kinase